MLSRILLFDLLGGAQGRASSLFEEGVIEPMFQFNKQMISISPSTLLQCTLEEVDAGG